MGRHTAAHRSNNALNTQLGVGNRRPHARRPDEAEKLSLIKLTRDEKASVWGRRHLTDDDIIGVPPSLAESCHRWWPRRVNGTAPLEAIWLAAVLDGGCIYFSQHIVWSLVKLAMGDGRAYFVIASWCIFQPDDVWDIVCIFGGASNAFSNNVAFAALYKRRSMFIFIYLHIILSLSR